MKLSQDQQLKTFLKKAHRADQSPDRRNVNTSGGHKLLLKSGSSVDTRYRKNTEKSIEQEIPSPSRVEEKYPRSSYKSSTSSKRNSPLRGDRRVDSPVSRISRDRADAGGHGFKGHGKSIEDSSYELAVLKRWYGSPKGSPQNLSLFRSAAASRMNSRKNSLSSLYGGEKSTQSGYFRVAGPPIEIKTRGFFKESQEEVQFEKLKSKYAQIGELLDDGMGFGTNWQPNEKQISGNPSQEKLAQFDELIAPLPTPLPEVTALSTSKSNRLELIPKQYFFYSVDLETHRDFVTFSKFRP